MAEKILILGPTGSGKTTSIRTLNSKETFIICPDEKTMPFKGSKMNYKTAFIKDTNRIDMAKSNYYETNKMNNIVKCCNFISNKMPHIKNVVIDTITYAMIETVMSRIKEQGWEKYNDFADETYRLFKLLPQLRKDLVFIIMAHSDTQSTNDIERTSMKIPKGKLLSDTVVPEGLFTVVLYADTIVVKENNKENIKGVFYTQRRNNNTCKSPEGMFPDFIIPNDLQYVLNCFNAYNNGEESPVLNEIIDVKLTKNEEDF